MSRGALRDADYRALAAFRAALRRFLRASADRARAAGITAQQHQLLLAIRGHAGTMSPVVGELAEALQVRPHTAVGLVDRVADAGLVRRVAAGVDRRRVGVELTARGRQALARISEENRLELAGLRRLLGRVPRPDGRPRGLRSGRARKEIER
jgi:DNA-binding MarR family transcriptional regulator